MPAALTPQDVTLSMLNTGEQKAKQRFYISFFKAWMAGWMLCLGAMVVQLIQGGSGTLKTDYPAIVGLLSAFFFPFGLVMLVLTGQELLTAHFMFMPMALLKGRIKAWQLPLNWLIVFCGNLAGALCCVAFMGHYSKLYTPALVTLSQGVAVTKTSEHWGPCVLRAIGCNFLVCTAVWLGATSPDVISKVIALHFPVFMFVFLGFEHVIVNMYYIPMGILNGAKVSVGKYIAMSLIPSFIGNVIGGCLLGIPMVLFWAPPELPFHNKHPDATRNSSSTIIRHSGDATPTHGMPEPMGKEGSRSTVLDV